MLNPQDYLEGLKNYPVSECRNFQTVPIRIVDNWISKTIIDPTFGLIVIDNENVEKKN